LYSAIIRDAEALGESVARTKRKRRVFSRFLSCQGVQIDDIVRLWLPKYKRSAQRQRKHGWQKLLEFEERLASVRGLTAVVTGDVWYEQW